MSDTSRPLTPVIMIHDGAIDEFVAEVLLAVAPTVDLLGVVMVDADCIGRIACDVMWKINDLAGIDIPIGLSAARGLNPFPWPYRGDCVKVSDLQILRDISGPPWQQPPDGDALLARLLDEATDQVVVLATGPISPLITAVTEQPARAAKISEVVWMAGAIDVRGNLDPTTIPPLIANPFAEWNVFWDPPAAQALFDLFDAPITLVPLDVSDPLAIDHAFTMPIFEAARTSRFARLCLDAYDLVASEPFYRLWDTATVAYFLRPDLFAEATILPMVVEVDPAGDQGALRESPSGKPLRLVLDYGHDGSDPVIELIASQIAAVR